MYDVYLIGRKIGKFSCMKVRSWLTEKRVERLILWLNQVVFKLKLKYKQTKYEENMTEISFKGVLRSTTVMFLSVGLVGI